MAVPSFESDLRTAREAARVSVEQVQQETRIPADVIQRFEAGKLLADGSFNEVYLKAFLRAYAGAVGLPSGRVLAAYEAAQRGAYAGELRPDYSGAPPATPPPAASSAMPTGPGPSLPRAEAGEAGPPPTRVPRGEPAQPAPPPTMERAPAVAALSRAPEPEGRTPPPHAPGAANEHFPKRRVEPPAAVATRRSFDRSWGTIIGVTVFVVAVVAVALWLMFRDPTPEADEAALAGADSAAAGDTTAAEDPAATAQPVATAGPRLALPLRITIVAEGDGLQAFRATEAPDDRRPYWLEPGAEETFESAQGITLWGEEGEGLDPAQIALRMQGFEWDPPAGQVLRLTPQNGQRLLDSLQAAGVRRSGASAPPAAQ